MLAAISLISVIFQPTILIQLPASVKTYQEIQDRCLDEAQRLRRGITFSVGMTDASGIAAQAKWPQWKYFDAVLDGALSRDIPRIRLKIGGGPPIHPTWQALNSDQVWNQPNRPPPGKDFALWARLSEYKQQLVDRVVYKVKTAGKDPTKLVEIELSTEPGKGGAGGPWLAANHRTFAPTDANTPEGTWDEAFHSELSYECRHIDFRGIPVLSPSFTFRDAQSFSTELATFRSPLGDAWRSKVTVWSVNLYGNISGSRDSSMSSALRNLEQKARQAIQLMRCQPEIGASAALSVGETGWTNQHLNRSGSRQDELLRGRVLRQSEDLLLSLGFDSVSTYALAEGEYGLFDLNMRPSEAYKGYTGERESTINRGKIEFNRARIFPFSSRWLAVR